MANDKSKLRSRIIPVRVTEKMYQDLVDIAEGYDIPVALYCYLAVRKAVGFQYEVMHQDDLAAEAVIP